MLGYSLLNMLLFFSGTGEHLHVFTAPMKWTWKSLCGFVNSKPTASHTNLITWQHKGVGIFLHKAVWKDDPTATNNIPDPVTSVQHVKLAQYIWIEKGGLLFWQKAGKGLSLNEGSGSEQWQISSNFYLDIDAKQRSWEGIECNVSKVKLKQGKPTDEHTMMPEGSRQASEGS